MSMSMYFLLFPAMLHVLVYLFYFAKKHIIYTEFKFKKKQNKESDRKLPISQLACGLSFWSLKNKKNNRN